MLLTTWVSVMAGCGGSTPTQEKMKPAITKKATQSTEAATNDGRTADELLHQAQQALSVDQVDQASNRLRKILIHDPHHAHALF